MRKKRKLKTEDHPPWCSASIGGKCDCDESQIPDTTKRKLVRIRIRRTKADLCRANIDAVLAHFLVEDTAKAKQRKARSPRSGRTGEQNEARQSDERL